jgi:hypothetical protein
MVGMKIESALCIYKTPKSNKITRKNFSNNILTLPWVISDIKEKYYHQSVRLSLIKRRKKCSNRKTRAKGVRRKPGGIKLKGKEGRRK